MERIRLGIIGCGGMANTHKDSMEMLKERVEVTCVCDIVAERAEAMAEVLHTKALTDYKDMVDLVDAVLIVLPHELHFEVGAFFVRRNKHVLMEKPMCVNEYECKTLMDAAREHHVTLMTAYPVRYWPGVRKLKELVDSGEYGDLFHMSIWTEQYTNRGPQTWQHSVKGLGGGQLFSHGCHYIDILLWFLGHPVTGSHVGTNFGTPWMEREGTSNVAIRFENGAVGYHMGTWGARGTQHGYCFQLQMTRGMLEYRHGEGKIYLYRNTSSDIPDEDARVLWEDDKGGKQTELEIAHFVDCVLHHKQPETDAAGSLQGLRVIWKLYEAEEKGIMADLRGLGLDEYNG